MRESYWVPAVERADKVLNKIALSPNTYRLVDLSRALEINKSSLFSLLNTLEKLNWVTKNEGDTYSLGPAIGAFSASYIRQFDILQTFYKEAAESVGKINEHIQLGVLEKENVVYIGKVQGESRVRVVTEPGMRFPAYASAIGKIQLTQYSDAQLRELFKDVEFERKTPFTITSIDDLCKHIELARRNGYATEHQESTEGFHCVSAPIYNYESKLIAGVSFTMPTSSWEVKQEEAKNEIIHLAAKLSEFAGHVQEFAN